MTENPYHDFKNVHDDSEAATRAEKFFDLDPFPEVPAALLSSEHIEAYVRVTGMLHPFYPLEGGRLKTASYEVTPGKYFIWWDENGRKQVTRIKPGGKEKFKLPANSITFMQIEPKIRLPTYIALRFNLRIKHVHRGLLLGTGPLVDPAFRGDLLIPLHNLTSEPYYIEQDEGIIWIEFTKTSHKSNLGKFHHFHTIETYKTDQPPEYYFEKANWNNPIQSSIPQLVKTHEEKANQAVASASEAKNQVRILAGLGVIAAVALVVAVHSALIAANNLAGTINKTATEAGASAQRALDENAELRSQIAKLLAEINELKLRNSAAEETKKPTQE